MEFGSVRSADPRDGFAVRAWRSLLHMARDLARDRRGAAAIEFGFVAIPLLFCLVVIFQIGFNYYIMASLDRAANEGARAIMTGQVSQAGLTAAQFAQQYVCPHLPHNMSCGSIVVNTSIVLKGCNDGTSPTWCNTFPQTPASPSNYNNSAYVLANKSGLTMPSTTQSLNSFCPGGPGDYVLLEILYPAPLFTKLLRVGGANIVYQMSTATFVNEPFAGAQAFAGC